MAENTPKQVEDFIIEYAVNAALEGSNYEVKHGRKAKDFVEYAKWVPFKCIEEPGKKKRVDIRTMVRDYFEADSEHYFELLRKIEDKKREIECLETVSS